MESMKLAALICIFALFCGLVGAQTTYRPEVDLWKDLDIWLYAGYGGGWLKEHKMIVATGGLSVDFKNRIRISAYGVTFCESMMLLTAPKYSFDGQGFQVGLVLPTSRVKFTPSIGYEYGEMKIGEGELNWNWFVHEYDSYRKEKISYIPFTVDIQVELFSWLALSGKVYHAENSDYPMQGFMFNICLGKI